MYQYGIESQGRGSFFFTLEKEDGLSRKREGEKIKGSTSLKSLILPAGNRPRPTVAVLQMRELSETAMPVHYNVLINITKIKMQL